MDMDILFDWYVVWIQIESVYFKQKQKTSHSELVYESKRS